MCGISRVPGRFVDDRCDWRRTRSARRPRRAIRFVVAKLFDVAGSATWWLTEYDPKDRIAFCYVTGMAYDEWGTTSIDELFELWMTFAVDPRRNVWRVQTTKPGIGTPRVELDCLFEPKRFSEVKQMVAKYALRANNAV
ncbi:hypothetical protein CS8_048510 [Cupriavidus sp. 8B]